MDNFVLVRVGGVDIPAGFARLGRTVKQHTSLSFSVIYTDDKASMIPRLGAMKGIYFLIVCQPKSMI